MEDGPLLRSEYLNGRDLSTVTQFRNLLITIPVCAERASPLGLHRHDHITPVLVGLHWLSVRQRIIYKTAVLVWKCLHDAAPRYLADLCAGPLHAKSPATTFHGVWDSAGLACQDCYRSAQLRHQWTTNMEQFASRP